jgi:hypothetical protein
MPDGAELDLIGVVAKLVTSTIPERQLWAL